MKTKKSNQACGMVKSLLRRAVTFFVAGSLAFGSVPVYAQGAGTPSGASEFTVSGSWSLDLWHYSGGYWKVGNKGSEQIRIEDKDIRSLDGYLQANHTALFRLDAPQEVLDLISQGSRGTDWEVTFANYRGRDVAMLFAEKRPDSISISDGKVEFSATPLFHFNHSGLSLRDYVSGMTATVPLVDKKWGCNIYSMFGNGASAVQGLGYFNEDDLSDTGSNAIHPSFIRSKGGELEAGHPFTLGSRVVDSAGYTIGNGTFAAAGACGLHFEFPVSLVFTDLRSGGADPGGDPGTGDDPGSGGNPGGGENPGDGNDPGTGDTPGDGNDPGTGDNPGDPTDPTLDPSDPASLKASLELPAQSYVGHDVPAKDASIYEVDGKTIHAARAAELGLGTSSFSLVQKGVGSLRKSGKTGAVAVFNQPGTYQVKLTATASNGMQDADTRSIQILKTPAILEDLGGVQKENRKQSLIVTVAQDPRHPVCELSIRLTETQSGESITVFRVFGGEQNKPQNTEHIKYRSLSDGASDALYLRTQLDFLTKWHEAKTLSYEIRVKDDAGNSDTAAGQFLVAPDLPPLAAIDLEDVYHREEGGGAARITAECASSSDGDALVRTWEYREEGGTWRKLLSADGFEDLSFGSGKRIAFDKKQVGAFSVRLTVKELWTEETLAEYVSESDRLSASSQELSLVDNVAPRVGLDLLRTEKAELFVLTESDKTRADVMAAAPSLKAALLSEGIACTVNADHRQADAGEVTGQLTEVTTGGSGAHDYRESEQQLYSAFFSGMWDGGNLICDGRYSYMLLPSVQTYAAEPRYSIHTYPFTLTARDENGKTVWSTAVTRAILDSESNLRDARWGLDADGTYLYLIDGGKTALFDIRTGTYVATLAQELGVFNLVYGDFLYAFKSDGIWRMPRSGGALKCVYAGELSSPVFLGGSVQFVQKADLGKGMGLYRGVFDAAGETVRCSLLQGSLAGYAKDAQCLAIDALGSVFVHAGSQVYCFDANDLLQRTIALKESNRSAAVVPVWTGSGRVTHVAQTGYEKYKRYYEVWCICTNVETGESYSDSREKEDNYPNFGEPVVFALQDASGAIGISLGCNYVYATGERYLDSILFSFNGDFDNPMGFPMEHGVQSIRYLAATANTGGTRDIKQIVHIGESRTDEEARLTTKHLGGSASYSYYLNLAGNPTQEGVAAALNEAVQAIRSMKEQGENAAVLNEAGSLSRSISLAPDTTYYYEYETSADEDILSIRTELLRPAGMADGGGFEVVQSHVENFDDAATQPFFAVDSSAIEGGRYRIASLRTSSTSYPEVQTGRSYPIRFTVPEGYRAVFFADYAYRCDEADPLGKRLLLSRQGGASFALDLPEGFASSSGTYMHAQLLESGVYTLSCTLQMRTRASGRSSDFWIDNLNVVLVAEADAQENPGQQALPTRSSVSGDGVMKRVTGSFTTPQQVMHYGLYPCERVTGVRNAFSSLSEETRGYTKLQTFALNLPSGRQALYAVLRAKGRGASYTTSAGKERYDNVNWTWDDALIGINTRDTSGTMALYALPDEPHFVWKNLSGSHSMRISAETRNGADAALTDLLLYVNKEGTQIPAALQQGRFFEEGGKLYAEDLVFSGAGTVNLTAPAGTAIRNLRIYSVQSASEVTALTCDFKQEDDLSAWGGQAENASIEALRSEKEEPARVYAKGEPIQYQVFYSDYENDPSKRQHWVYTHEALTDGAYPQAGKDLPAPVTSFNVDGKYTAIHWQEDRTGNPAFDKASNRVEITFYINSGPSNDAPRVTDIRTVPGAVKQGQSYTVKAFVDDEDKDPLTVKIEVYKDKGGQPIASKTEKNVKPNASGRYPEIILTNIPKAEPGTYDIVVTAKDETGADVETMRFTVKEERSLTGSVTHTAAWEANRIAWNEAKKGTDAVRAPNVFWPGETLVLNAPAGGDPLSVDAQIVEFPQYAVRLTRGAVGSDGKVQFSGQLWHNSMLQTIGTSKPVPATVRFTAHYADGEALTWDVAIVFDQSKGSYYQLHRNY